MEIMASLALENGQQSIFYKVFDANDFSYLGDDDKAKQAWAIAANIKVGIEERKDRLSADNLAIIRHSLFEKFNELGVSSHMLMAILIAFGAVNEAMNTKLYNYYPAKAKSRN